VSWLTSDVSPDEPATVTEVVTEARRHALYAVRRLKELGGGAGGRGAVAQVSACRALLEASRITGSEAEELVKMPLDKAKEVLGVKLQLVTPEKADELLSQRRMAERGSR
jgi:hypothetical protein